LQSKSEVGGVPPTVDVIFVVVPVIPFEERIKGFFASQAKANKREEVRFCKASKMRNPRGARASPAYPKGAGR
jgi:hypothetical protein